MKSETMKGDAGMSWEMVKLKNIIVKPFSGEWGDGVGNVNVIRTTNFNNDGSLNLKDVVRRNIKIEKVLQKRLVFGDTIIEKSGGSPTQPVGRVVYFNIENDIFLCNNFTSVIRSKSEIDKRYLFWFLFSNHLNQNTLKYQNKTTGIINLQLEKYITDLEIPLPPLPIQKRIAGILDAADALRRKDQELLLKYDKLAQAIFIDMFGDPVKNEKGWEVKTIGDVCYSVKDGPHVSPKYTKTGIPFISVNNIINGVIDISNCKYISQEDFEIYSKKGKPEKQDILYTKGGTTGFAKRVDVDFEFSQWVHVALLKFNHHIINSAFFEYMLNNSFCYNQSQLRTKGIANRDLVLGEIKKIQILLPPIQKQREFESKILLLEKARKGNLESIDRSSSLFNSLLQQAFKGNLVK